MQTITIYRPVGEKEMILIINSNYAAFPPRLEWQPIFYPVLNEGYANQIASEWNTNDSFGNYLGFVTKFSIDENIFRKYSVQNVGNTMHNELWVPASDLEEFNNSIQGRIEVINVFIGKEFKHSENENINLLVKHFK